MRWGNGLATAKQEPRRHDPLQLHQGPPTDDYHPRRYVLRRLQHDQHGRRMGVSTCWCRPDTHHRCCRSAATTLSSGAAKAGGSADRMAPRLSAWLAAVSRELHPRRRGRRTQRHFACACQCATGGRLRQHNGPHLIQSIRAHRSTFLPRRTGHPEAIGPRRWKVHHSPRLKWWASRRWNRPPTLELRACHRQFRPRATLPGHGGNAGAPLRKPKLDRR